MSYNKHQQTGAMNDVQRVAIKAAVEEAYKNGQNNHAYYLELCLRLNDLPR